MAFDGIVTKAIVTELNKNIINARVEKIYMPNKLEVLFHLHSTEKYKLLISINPNNCRIGITNAEYENPIKAFQFCMVLRKYLQGNRIIKIEQHELDRIVIFTFEGIDDFGDKRQCKLIIELMGKHSNIILADVNNKIIDSIKHIDADVSSLREVLPAREYEFPQNQIRENFIGMSLPEFKSCIYNALSRPSSEEFSFSKKLANEFTGFSRIFTENLCKHVNISEPLTESSITNIYSNLNILLYNISEGLANLTNIGNDYHFDLSLYSTNSHTNTPLSDFLDKFYQNKENKEKLHIAKMDLQREVLSHICKYEKNLKRVNEIIEEEKDASYYKECGELLSSNIYRMKQGMKEITVENFYKNNEPLTISLNESYSPSRNAQAYFKKYSKLKNAIVYAHTQKEEYQKNINYLETVSYQISECENMNDLYEIKQELISQGIVKETVKAKKKEIIVSEPLKYIVDNVEILVGKNNIQNDKLTFKIANKNDTWLHTKDIHGSHVIIRSQNVTENVLFSAAKLAAEHSQSKGNGKTSVDYTLVKNVKKIPGAKPGMVIYTDYKTIIV